MKKISVILLSALFAILPVAAEIHSELKFKKIGLSEGLSYAKVSDIGQDERGYIWVATPDGLNRYDGYSFKIYRPQKDNSSSLGEKSPLRIAYGEDGSMWVSGKVTLSRYVESADNFENYVFDLGGTIADIVPLDTENILVGTSAGLYTFNIPTHSFERGFRGQDPQGAVSALAVDGDFVYVALPGGICKIGRKDGSMKKFPLAGNPPVTQMLPDGKTLLVATDECGLIRLDPATGKIYNYRAGGREGLGSDHVRSLAHDRQGRVWVGTFDGLDILDVSGRHFSHYDTNTQDNDNLSHASVRKIFADRQGGMWLGTFFGGLNYYHPIINQFQTIRHNPARPSLNDNVVGAMTEDAQHNIWIATNNGGLNVYDPQHNTFKYYTKSNGLVSNDVKTVYIDETADKVYIGTHLGGLSVLDRRTGRLTTPGNMRSNIYDIEPARAPGKLWLASLDTLLLYDPATGRQSVAPTNGLSRITDLYRDSKGRLWASGEDGVSAFCENTDGTLTVAPDVPEAINNYRLGVNNVYQSRDGRNYYLSTNDGLLCYDATTNSISQYTTEDGLPNDIVYGILEDANGNLWSSTNGGLAYLDPRSGEIRSYSSKDGLQCNQFNSKSFLSSSLGYFYFGGIDGITCFNPSVLQSNPYAPAPFISRLRLFNRDIIPGDDTGLLDRSISQTEKITFDVDQTVFTIDFTVCNYVAGDHNTYAYMLEGLDRQWTTIEGPGSVTYSNLPAGDYKFLLKAANNDGIWSEEVTSLDITILPQWYNRWWARTLFILLAIGLIFAVLSYLWHRKSRLQHQRLAALDLERQKELNEMKVRFFINMSHELRTPLTLILLPVRELLQLTSNRKVAQKLTIVKNNAERILRIVNQLLDYRRAEMGMFKLKVMPVAIHDMLRDICANYDNQAAHRNINFTYRTELPGPIAVCDPQYMELICNNLISNAFKYTPEGGSISVEIAPAEQNTGDMMIKVSDTGCGIPDDKLRQIFTRFYQVDDRVGGSGIGLSLVKRLVELHHGSISVSSKLNEGSTFIVTIPAEAKAYSAEETAAEPTEPTPRTDETLPDIPEMESEEISGIADEGADDRTNKDTLLIVDDNADILKYLCEQLSADFNVVPAADGAKALEILGTQEIDLVITDIMMPDIDGVQLCRTIKRNIRTSHIPVVMLSAKNDIPDQISGLKVGADDYIAKPFSMEILMAKIRNQLRTRRLAIRHFAGSAQLEPEAAAALNPLDEEFLKKAFEIMERHLDDTDFSTDVFAGEMCMSRSNLHLKMKALTGESTNEFVRRFRLTKAMELLKAGRHTIAQISAMVGFGTPSYFATSFKKFYGHLPSEYIRN